MIQKAFGLLVLFTACSSAILAQGASEKRVRDEILVKFSPNVSASVVGSAHRSLRASKLEELGDLGWQLVKLPGNLSVDEAIARYELMPGVEAVQPNYYYRLLAEPRDYHGLFLTPNDPQFPLAGMYGLNKISAPAAWDLSTGSSSVVVANIDTGARYTHEDLAANMWTNPGEINGNGVDDDNNGFIDDFYGWDFFFNDANPVDEHGHGTHTSGTIGALGNNGLGVVGVNWNVKIMTIKIYDNDGFGSTAAMLINAYNYIRMMKNRGINIRVTNNSYGGCDEACGYDQATKDAIDALGRAGVLQVFAAGNDGRNIETTPSFPASYNTPAILSIASSTSTDTRSGFSNWGAQSVDLAAPGSSILSTTWGSNSSYGSMSGTSMAAPHVTGAAALLAAYNPGLNSDSLKATLMNTVDTLSGWTTTPVKTNGRLNVARALQQQTVCTFALSDVSMRVPTKGGQFTVNATSGTNCEYSARSNVHWIQVSGQNTFSGNGSITFRVNFNPTLRRTGTITIGSETFTVTQSRS